MLPSNRFEQLPVDDDAKGTVNVEHNDKNLKKKPKRTRVKESQGSEADWNLNNCNSLIIVIDRPWSQIVQITWLSLKDELLLWTEDQKIKISLKERKLYLEDKTSVNRKKNPKTSNDLVIFGNSITNFSRYKKIFPIKDLLNCQGDINQINYMLQNIEHIVYKCRQFDLKNILSCITITNRLPE